MRMTLRSGFLSKHCALVLAALSVAACSQTSKDEPSGGTGGSKSSTTSGTGGSNGTGGEETGTGTGGNTTVPLSVFDCKGNETDIKCTTDDANTGKIGSGPLFHTAPYGGRFNGGTLDIKNNRLLLMVGNMPQKASSLYAVDLKTGDRKVISGVEKPEAEAPVRGAGPSFGLQDGGVQVASKGTIFVNTSQGLMKIDESTGDRTLVRSWEDANDTTECRFIGAGHKSFALAEDDDTFYFGYNSAIDRGFIRYTLSKNECVAFSRCKTVDTGVDGAGTGPCIGAAPAALTLFDKKLYNVDFIAGALMNVDVQTGERKIVSQKTSATTVGNGSSCVYTNWMTVSDKIFWTSGNQCSPEGDLNLTRIDPATGDRSAARTDAGPLNIEEVIIWGYPSQSLLLVGSEKNKGIAWYDPEKRRSAWLSR